MRKVLIIATVVLVFILALIFMLNSFKKPQVPTDQANISPTTVPFETFNNEQILSAGQSLAPYESENFSFNYSPEQNKMVVQEKTTEGYQEYVTWISDNGLPELVGNPELVVFESAGDESLSTGSTTATGNRSTANNLPATGQSQETDFDPLIDFLNIFMNFGQGLQNVQTTPNPSNPAQPTQPPVSGQPSGKLVYYAQCNGFGNISLPSGCTLCQSGCGPTTVAMIAASYLGDGYDPQRIVNLYQQRGYFLGCGGSRYADAKAALESLGLKTTSYMSYNLETADRVATDFKKYIDAGWTIFTLANFRADGGGHFFWITEVKAGEIFAYDPYYGKSSVPPINENDRYPFPKYRLAFGVKR